MKKGKVVIIHGSNKNDRENMIKYNLPPQNERDWIGWIKEELTKGRIDCVAPLMPENWAPVYEKWKREFEKINIENKDILTGWSSGGTFLVRWLGENKVRAKKLILVAPAVTNEIYTEEKEFHDFKINLEIKERFEEVVLIISDNDSKGSLKSCEVYSQELKLKPKVLHNKGHFTGYIMGREFPELLEEVLKTK